MLLTEPGATMVALTTLLGFYWLIVGVLALVQVFVDPSLDDKRCNCAPIG
jgi:uncharacterized membrane protein HdeD (DUF308 family)